MTRSKVWFWAALACLIAVLALDLWFLIGPVNNLYDSDSADTLMWAEAAYNAGKPVSDTFYYASVLPFGGQLLMLPFIGAFGATLTTHILGMALFWLLLTAAVVGLFRAMEWSWAESLFASAIVLLLFGSGRNTMGMYFQHIIYYSLATFFLMTGLALLMRIARAEKAALERPGRGRVYALCAALTAWFALACTNGVMSLACFAAPCLGAYALERLLDADFSFRRDWRCVALTALLASAMLAGAVVNKRLVAGSVGGLYGEFHSTFSDPADWGSNLIALPQIWVEVWTDHVEQYSFMSREGVKSAFGVGCALLFAAAPIGGLICYRKLETRWERIIVLTHAVMTALICFGSVFGMISTRFYGVHDTAVLSTLVVLRHGLKKWTIPWKRVAALMAAVMIAFAGLCGAGLTRYGRETNEKTENAARAYGTAAFLKEHGLDFGYAMWWNCNSYSVLSGGDIRFVPIKYKAGWGRWVQDTYQSDESWYLPQPGQEKYFVMLTQDELDACGGVIPEGAAETLTYDRYTIYVYNGFPFERWLEQE